MRVCTIFVLAISFLNFAHAKETHRESKQFWTCIRTVYSDVQEIKNKVRLACQDPASEACTLARAEYEIAKAGIGTKVEECKSALPQEGAI